MNSPLSDIVRIDVISSLSPKTNNIAFNQRTVFLHNGERNEGALLSLSPSFPSLLFNRKGFYTYFKQKQRLLMERVVVFKY